MSQVYLVKTIVGSNVVRMSEMATLELAVAEQIRQKLLPRHADVTITQIDDWVDDVE